MDRLRRSSEETIAFELLSVIPAAQSSSASAVFPPLVGSLLLSSSLFWSASSAPSLLASPSSRNSRRRRPLGTTYGAAFWRLHNDRVCLPYSMSSLSIAFTVALKAKDARIVPDASITPPGTNPLRRTRRKEQFRKENMPVQFLIGCAFRHGTTTLSTVSTLITKRSLQQIRSSSRVA